MSQASNHPSFSLAFFGSPKSVSTSVGRKYFGETCIQRGFGQASVPGGCAVVHPCCSVSGRRRSISGSRESEWSWCGGGSGCRGSRSSSSSSSKWPQGQGQERQQQEQQEGKRQEGRRRTRWRKRSKRAAGSKLELSRLRLSSFPPAVTRLCANDLSLKTGLLIQWHLDQHLATLLVHSFLLEACSTPQSRFSLFGIWLAVFEAANRLQLLDETACV